MHDIDYYVSPIGTLLLISNGRALTGLWQKGQKNFPAPPEEGWAERTTPILAQTRQWLDLYFSGRDPGFTPPLDAAGTPFQKAVWALLRTIPFGQTVTYGALAEKIAAGTGKNASPRAVGSAAGRTPISIIIPCHRLIGAGGNPTGYAAGLSNKIKLLQTEGVFLPPSRRPAFSPK